MVGASRRARAGTRAEGLSPEQKAEIAAVCERFIARRLKPRFLPAICETPYNYAIDLFGRWRGNSYSFITRYRSGSGSNLGAEFDSAFVRLDFKADDGPDVRFDVMWHRSTTGRWYRVYDGVTLARALRLIETDELLEPL